MTSADPLTLEYEPWPKSLPNVKSRAVQVLCKEVSFDLSIVPLSPSEEELLLSFNLFTTAIGAPAGRGPVEP